MDHGVLLTTLPLTATHWIAVKTYEMTT